MKLEYGETIAWFDSDQDAVQLVKAKALAGEKDDYVLAFCQRRKQYVLVKKLYPTLAEEL